MISMIESKFEQSLVDEVEALLLTHELRLQKFRKKVISDSASVNLTQGSASNPPSSPDPATLQVHLSQQFHSDQSNGLHSSVGVAVAPEPTFNAKCVTSMAIRLMYAITDSSGTTSLLNIQLHSGFHGQSSGSHG